MIYDEITADDQRKDQGLVTWPGGQSGDTA